MQTYRRLGRLGAVVALGAATALTAGLVLASDHQDTPEVEINPRMDINDVYAFPGASADRITLVMTTSSPSLSRAARSRSGSPRFWLAPKPNRTAGRTCMRTTSPPGPTTRPDTATGGL